MKRTHGIRLFILLVGIALTLLGVFFIRTVDYDGECIKFIDYQIWGIKKADIFATNKDNISSIEIGGGIGPSMHSHYSSWVEFSNGRKEILIRANSEKRVRRIYNQLKHCLKTGDEFKIRRFPARVLSYGGLFIIFMAYFGSFYKSKNNQ